MQPQLASNGIDHVSLLAPNLQRTAQFYVDVLGLQTIDHALVDEPSAPGRLLARPGRADCGAGDG